MSTTIKRWMAVLLSVAVVLTMCVSTAFADGHSSTVDHSNDAEEITCTLHMFQPRKGGVKYGTNTNESTAVTDAIDKDKATVDIYFDAAPSTRKYEKIAFVDQSKTDAEKDAAAISAASITQNSEGKNVAHYKVTLPVEDLGKALPISFYEDNNGTKAWHTYTSSHTITFNYTPLLVKLLMCSIYDFTEHTGYK
ncbi:MAG: hypothetical protein ACI4LM_07295, partial [Anaerovoracaceae bacterium]